MNAEHVALAREMADLSPTATLADLAEAVAYGLDPLIRADERQIMLAEMAALARELETARKFTAATIVKEMWNRACRRRAKHS